MGFRKTARSARIALMVLIGLGLSACAPATPSPSPTLAPSATPLPPTATATATPTPPPPTATPSPTHTPTITLTPTPSAAFDQLQIMAVENIVSGVRVNLLLPNVSVAYDILIRGYEYNCTIEPTVKDHLFCFGLAQLQAGQTVPMVFYDPRSGEKIYTTDAYYAGFFTATPGGSYGQNDCPQRGENVSCETECRLLPGGSYCVVATCTDACGLYFSVNSCPQDMSEDFSSCSEEQWAEAKLIFSIP